MINIKSSVLLNERLTQNCWHMVLEATLIASEAKPGQFINVKIGKTNDPLFRRPFNIFKCVNLNGSALGIEIVYGLVGRGTRVMADLRHGDELDIIGPLGHGFEWSLDKKVHVLLGGGIGSAALFMLGEQISKVVEEYGVELNILLGAKTREELVLEREFKRLNGRVLVSTDDGTYGYHGFVTEMLTDNINSGKISPQCKIYGCGPKPMLKALALICLQYGIPAQVSVERHMMCGIGACLSCVCKVNKNTPLRLRDPKSSQIQFIPEEKFGYALVCKDGPVFYMDELIFDE